MTETTAEPQVEARAGVAAIPGTAAEVSPDSKVVMQAGEARSTTLEALRGVAATAVVAYHVSGAGNGIPRLRIVVPNSPGELLHATLSRGGMGVVLFFALSGFLLFRPFARTLILDHPAPNLRTYYTNRLLRILPLYWVVLLTTAIVLEWHYFTPRTAVIFATLTENYFPDTFVQVAKPFWTLVVEVGFYALLPLTTIGLCRQFAARRGRRGVAVVLIVAGCLSALGQIVAHLLITLRGGVGDINITPWPYLLPFVFYLFVPGMLLALASIDQSWLETLPRWARQRVTWLVAIFLSGALVVAAPYDFRYLLAWIPSGLVLGALVLRLEGSNPLARVLGWRPLALIGIVSYGIYLWHFPILEVLFRYQEFTGAILGVKFAILFGATLALSAVTYICVERPFLLLRRRWTPAARQPGLSRPAAVPRSS